VPGTRLEPDDGAELPKFAVVGAYDPAGDSSFVQHVAILRDKCSVKYGEEVAVWHTAPPIVAGERTSSMSPNVLDTSPAHVAAYLDDLSAGDVQGIETVLADIDAQTQPLSTWCANSTRRARLEGYRVHYTAHPPVQWIRDAKTGRRRYRKFSCSGFVVECYKGADIVLVHASDEALPEVDLPTLRQGYGSLLDDSGRRNSIGLDGKGPWRMLLAGYVIHAAARDASEIRAKPYCPNGIDAARFP